MTPTDRLHVITGGPDSGKTSLIDALAAAGIATSPEVGRAVIREELAAGGTVLPWDDERLFAEKMVVREVAAHAAALARGETVVLDRAVPDVVGFLRASGCPVPAAIDRAARQHRYNARVFLAPFWADIYTHDPERRQSAEHARVIEAVMRDAYAGYGYRLLELPRVPVAERVAFVLRALGSPAARLLPRL